MSGNLRFRECGITFAVFFSKIPTYMSKPKSFLLPLVAHMYRTDAIEKILFGWVAAAKHYNPEMTDTRAVSEFLEHHDMKAEWNIEWANQCLQRFRGLVRENGGAI